jgi:serine/threonine protein kinase
MGEVYKARDTRLDRTVALKVLLADSATDSDDLPALRAERSSAPSMWAILIVPLQESEHPLWVP